MFENWLAADWPAPAAVKAGVTTRLGGVSIGPYAEFNLGDHVGDDPSSVAANRAKLIAELKITGHCYWLTQVHSATILDLDPLSPTDHLADADGALTHLPEKVVCVLTADCLPILLCDQQGTEVAALHAGWRGLAQGIIPSAIGQLRAKPDQLLVWLGPAISSKYYEVGDEIYTAFVGLDPNNASAFDKNARDRWQCDLYALARLQLQRCGVTAIYGGQYCTFQQDSLFYSYRRQAVTGRQASLIWLEK